MRPGDQLRFRGPAGAPFVVTVGVAWDEKTIRARIESGEWTPMDGPAEKTTADPPPTPPQPPADTPTAQAESKADRPPVNAPKAAWIDHVVRRGALSREDAANYTKADLIDLAS